VAEKYLRHLIQAHESIIPTILEIPSKETSYDPKKDPIM
jgi:vacuolar-type H+-ATPase subunit F/Vma7